MSQSTAVGSAFTTDARSLKTQLSQGKIFFIDFNLILTSYGHVILVVARNSNQTAELSLENTWC